jgi:cytochrome c biogenesis protein CcmG, thiol:disulfide interchange protein DsbE
VTNPVPPETTPPGRSSTSLVVGIVLAVVLIAALVAIFVVGDDDAADTGPTAPTENGPVDDGPVDTEPGATTPADDPPVDDGAADDGTLDDPRLPPEFAGEVRPVEIEGDSLPSFSPDGDDPALGMRPPLLVAEDVAGSVYTISPDIDGPVMVVFLAHWCPVCDEEIPHLAELQRDGRLPDDLQVFGVLTGIAPDRPNFPPSEWAVDRGWPWPAVADGIDFDQDPPAWAAADAFGLSAYPYVVLSDDGVVVDRWSGGLGVDGLEARIGAAVG